MTTGAMGRKWHVVVDTAGPVGVWTDRDAAAAALEEFRPAWKGAVAEFPRADGPEPEFLCLLLGRPGFDGGGSPVPLAVGGRNEIVKLATELEGTGLAEPPEEAALRLMKPGSVCPRARRRLEAICSIVTPAVRQRQAAAEETFLNLVQKTEGGAKKDASAETRAARGLPFLPTLASMAKLSRPA